MKVYLGRKNQNRLSAHTHTLGDILRILGVRFVGRFSGVNHYLDETGQGIIRESEIEVARVAGRSRRDLYPDELERMVGEAADEFFAAMDMSGVRVFVPNGAGQGGREEAARVAKI